MVTAGVMSEALRGVESKWFSVCEPVQNPMRKFLSATFYRPQELHQKCHEDMVQTHWGGERNSLERKQLFLERGEKETKTNPEFDTLTTCCSRLVKILEWDRQWFPLKGNILLQSFLTQTLVT